MCVCGEDIVFEVTVNERRGYAKSQRYDDIRTAKSVQAAEVAEIRFQFDGGRQFGGLFGRIGRVAAHFASHGALIGSSS
jgi:hypothetical protein